MDTRVGVLPPRGNDRIELITVEDGRALRMAGLAEFVNRCRDVRLLKSDLYVEDPTARKELAPLIRLISGSLLRIRGASASIKVRTMDAAVIDGKPGAWVKVEAYRYSMGSIVYQTA